MAKFKNNSPHDVYVDLGRLLRVQAGEVIELAGALSCPPLTMLPDEVVVVPKKLKKKKSKASSVSGTI